MIKNTRPKIKGKAVKAMLNFDAEKLVKGAKEGLEKAEKLGGQPGEAAKGILKGLKNAEKPRSR